MKKTPSNSRAGKRAITSQMTRLTPQEILSLRKDLQESLRELRQLIQMDRPAGQTPPKNSK